MAIEVVMPRLGWGGEEGSLVEWIKHDGDQVHVGDVLCTVEGDKAVSEVESLDSGILRIPPDSPRPGTKVPVGTILAYLIAPGETAPFEQTATVQSTTAVSAESAIPLPVMTVPMAPATATPRATRQGSPAISPRAWRVAEELGVNWTALQGSGSSGRIVERDVRRAAAEATVQRAEAQIGPLARRTAAEASADLEALAQAKTGQRITRADVEAAARTRNVAPPASQNAATPDTEPIDLSIRRTPLSSVRQIIARRLDESARTTVPVTLTTEADATDLVRLRAQIKVDLTDTNLPVPSYNDLLAKLVALALQEHPELNSSLDGQEIVQHTRINVGIAVDTERGL
ncbi:MAG TPA: 2-oxo acid dehydrogenase subunit E2, partial [Chloroflexota bacterium]|nr:2-oxo acid dehydrogenase subunit E2 [Chloroflexota bacterium]